jgi:hypothetical protein
MGGRGSGGGRIGAGRKPKDAHLRAIQGGKSRRPGASAVPPPVGSTEVAPVDVFDPPPQLFLVEVEIDSEKVTVPNREALDVWAELAPEAFKLRTLNRSTVNAFAILCRAVASERRMSDYGPDHRGLIQRVGTLSKDFGVTPLGKPMIAAPGSEKPKSDNPLNRFLKNR